LAGRGGASRFGKRGATVVNCSVFRQRGVCLAGRHVRPRRHASANTENNQDWEYAMLANIKPGQWVTIKVTKQPRAESRRKTLIRICEKDPAVRKERQRLKRSRVVRMDRRGGRLWADRPARVQAIRTCPGSTYKVFASVDVLRELSCIANNIEVKPA